MPCKHGNFSMNCGGCEDQAELREKRKEVERLKEELEKLRTAVKTTSPGPDYKQLWLQACDQYARKNRSGCTCAMDPDTDAIIGPCAAHAEWKNNAVTAERRLWQDEVENLRAGIRELVNKSGAPICGDVPSDTTP